MAEIIRKKLNLKLLQRFVINNIYNYYFLIIIFSLQVSHVVMGWVTAGLLLQLEPRNNILAKEPHPAFFEVVHLINVGETIAFLESLL